MKSGGEMPYARRIAVEKASSGTVARWTGVKAAVIDSALIMISMLAVSCALDALVHSGQDKLPRVRTIKGLAVHGLLVLAGCGLFLLVNGHLLTSAVLCLVLMAALVVASNAKNTVLGEPLVFSDLALIGAIFRHPQFYLSALRPWQMVLLGLGAMAMVALQVGMFVPSKQAHLAGLALAAGSFVMLRLITGLPQWRKITESPDLIGDVQRHGLLATLLLHFRRWRQQCDPYPCALSTPVTQGAELLVIVQCESFADPADLFGDPALSLPGLAAARCQAWQWGRLLVPGFGAYTMRTEYGVIFGRSEEELGFRRFDPFLTALGETSYAAPARLKAAGWHSVFVHPHDLRFYGRHQIMPAAGFDDMIGQDAFDPPASGGGRYVPDSSVARRILDLASAASQPTMIYTVTIENHGPWPPDPATGGLRHSSAYERLARNSDAMLTALMGGLAQLQRPAVLVFFGDHRPSIPGLVEPGGDRHTPYVILRLNKKGEPQVINDEPVDLTPAQLHHAIFAAMVER